jgi:hypothetical protein
MSFRTILIAVGGALALVSFNCAGADAGPVFLYDNLSSPVTGGDPAAIFPVGLGPLFASFSNTSGARTLTELELNLSATNPSDGQTFTVSVWSDKSTAPETELWSTTVNDSVLSAIPTVEDFATNVSLNADTRYWVGVSSADGSAIFSSATIFTGIGVANEFYINSNGEVPNDPNGPYVMGVLGTPEPGTWALMLVGFAGLGFAGYRYRRKGLITLAV